MNFQVTGLSSGEDIAGGTAVVFLCGRRFEGEGGVGGGDGAELAGRQVGGVTCKGKVLLRQRGKRD